MSPLHLVHLSFVSIPRTSSDEFWTPTILLTRMKVMPERRTGTRITTATIRPSTGRSVWICHWQWVWIHQWIDLGIDVEIARDRLRDACAVGAGTACSPNISCLSLILFEQYGDHFGFSSGMMESAKDRSLHIYTPVNVYNGLVCFSVSPLKSFQQHWIPLFIPKLFPTQYHGARPGANMSHTTIQRDHNIEEEKRRDSAQTA